MKGVPFPPNLLENIITKDYPKLLKSIRRVSQLHDNLIYGYYPTESFVGIFLSVFFLRIFFFGDYFPLMRWSNLLALVELALVVIVWIKPLFAFEVKRYSAQELWDNLPSPPSVSGDSMNYGTSKAAIKNKNKADKSNVSQSEMEEMLKPLPEEEREKFEKVLRKEITVTPEEKRGIFKYLNEKKLKEKWTLVLFGNSKRVKVKKANPSIKYERMKSYCERHEQSTLNKETGLDYIRTMRKYLQSPAEQYLDPKPFCIKFALEEIEIIEELSASLDSLSNDFPLRYSLEYHLGVYSLYAAQIKWYNKQLIGVEHLVMRDHYMHGIEHNYSTHLSEQGTSQIKKDVKYLIETIKPVLKHQQNIDASSPSIDDPSTQNL